MKNIIKRTMVVAFVIVILLMVTACNRDVFDTNYEFDYAIVKMPDGSVENIEINKWRDYDGEQIQIIASDGNIYLVSMNNCVLINDYFD